MHRCTATSTPRDARRLTSSSCTKLALVPCACTGGLESITCYPTAREHLVAPFSRAPPALAGWWGKLAPFEMFRLGQPRCVYECFCVLVGFVGPPANVRKWRSLGLGSVSVAFKAWPAPETGSRVRSRMSVSDVRSGGDQCPPPSKLGQHPKQGRDLGLWWGGCARAWRV